MASMLPHALQQRVKPLLKQLRAEPRLNAPVTTSLRWVLQRSGRDWPAMTRRLLRAGEFRLELPGVMPVWMHSAADDQVSNELFWYGWRAHEADTMPLFLELARRASCILDVGAHIGLYALAAARVSPGATVHAFEPIPSLQARVVQNVRLNGFTSVELHPVAVGAQAGEAQFHFLANVPLSMVGGLAPGRLDGSPDATTMKVPVVTLDDTLGGQKVDLLKMDTETTEPQVLEGARTILQRDQPTIITEVLNQECADALTRILAPLGYRFYPIEPARLERTDGVRGGQRSRNCLATTMDDAQVAELARAAARFS